MRPTPRRGLGPEDVRSEPHALEADPALGVGPSALGPDQHHPVRAHRDGRPSRSASTAGATATGSNVVDRGDLGSQARRDTASPPRVQRPASDRWRASALAASHRTMDRSASERQDPVHPELGQLLHDELGFGPFTNAKPTVSGVIDRRLGHHVGADPRFVAEPAERHRPDRRRL